MPVRQLGDWMLQLPALFVHRPALHTRPEQQSLEYEQVVPDWRHIGGGGGGVVQNPPVPQTSPAQHCDEAVHVLPLDVHVNGSRHVPFVHESPEQQSFVEPHDPPATWHMNTGCEQAPPLQAPEQQAPSLEHDQPSGRHCSAWHRPDTQLSPDAQARHCDPLAPHAIAVLPGSQKPVAVQHPVGQTVASQRGAPPPPH